MNSKEERVYITVTCPYCGKAWMKQVSSSFFREAPQSARCPECKKKGCKRARKKKEYTEEEKEVFKARMKKAREAKKQNER